MTFIFRISLLLSILFAPQQTSAQEAIKNNIVLEAEKMAQAMEDGDYELLMDYTHPNILRVSGGKQKMAAVVAEEMAKMADNGFTFESVEIGEPSDIALKQDGYQALVPKTTTLLMNGKKIVSNDFLYGFSDAEGKKWTFVEAKQLKSEAGKQLFPNFDSSTDIPKAENPIVVDSDGDIEVLEIDENAGTYDTPFEKGRTIGFMLGIGLTILAVIGLIVGLVFLILYLKKQKKKTPVVAAAATQGPKEKKSLKIACANCAEENSGDTKYCAFCGHALVR